MSAQSPLPPFPPFNILSALPNFSNLPDPPAWLISELQQRLVLLLNHVLQQEPEAMQRLMRKKGQIAAIEYGRFAISFIVTPAGLLNLAPADKKPDLHIRVQSDSPLVLLKTLLQGDRPRMEISGDVMLAAEIQWLVDHVRWDVEEDLARIIGDVPANSMMRVLRGLGDALKQFIAPKVADVVSATEANNPKVSRP